MIQQPFISRRLVLVGAACSTTGLAPDAGLSQQAAVGLVAELRGEASAEVEAQQRRLALRASVLAGDLIATGPGARVLLRLGASTTVRLGGTTRLRLTRLSPDSDAEFDFLAGHIMFERKARGAGGSVLFRSAYGRIVAGIERFYVGPNRGQFAVLVGEGAVELNAAGRVVQIRAQEAVEIKGPGHPPSAPGSWALPRVREMQAYYV